MLPSRLVAHILIAICSEWPHPSLVPSLSAPQIFIACSMRRGKAGYEAICFKVLSLSLLLRGGGGGGGVMFFIRKLLISR